MTVIPLQDSLLADKLQKLRVLLEGKCVLVAFSGGVDSSSLLFLAKRFCSKVVAVTVDTVILPLGEVEEARAFAENLNVKHIIVKVDSLKDPNFVSNPINRCYLCKKHILEKLEEVARAEECDLIVDGTNASDIRGDYRPGIQALKEHGVLSPFAEAGITKEEVRILASSFGLKNIAEKPSSACLATRIPYGSKITEEKLKRIGEAEKFIKEVAKIRVLRVRDHEGLARIEVGKDEREKLFNIELLEKIADKLKNLGFNYICFDIEGYKTGSLNPVL